MHIKPCVTLALISYNQAQFIAEAIAGALSQTYSPLEIIISDDCSLDGTYDIISKILSTYTGPHTLVINRNPQNIGLIKHVDYVTSIAAGEIVVMAAGDDISKPNRVEMIVAAYLASDRQSQYFHSSCEIIDQYGINGGMFESPGINNFKSLLKCALSNMLAIGATQAWTKQFYSSFTKIHSNVWAEDLIVGFRAMLCSTVCYVPEALVYYRHGIGLSSRSSDITATQIKNEEYMYRHVLRQRAVDCFVVGNYYMYLLLNIILVSRTPRLMLQLLKYNALRVLKACVVWG